MKLCMFTPVEHEIRGWPGRIEGDRVIQLAAQTLQAFFTGGGQAREHAEYPLDEVRLLAPVRAAAVGARLLRLRGARPQRARGLRGRGEVPPEWYEIPVFYFSNPAAIYGPDDEIPYPEGSEALDYELEVAAVIGADGQIGGFTVMNDWSARDLQRRRWRSGSGRRRARTSPRASARCWSRRTSSATCAGDGRAGERRGALAREPRRHVPLVGGDRRARGAQHGAAARRRARLGHGRHGLHPRARRRALAAAGDVVELEVEGIGVLREHDRVAKVKVAVIGGGVMGLATGWALHRRGPSRLSTSSSRSATRAVRATGARGSSGWRTPRTTTSAWPRSRSGSGASSRPRAARRCSSSTAWWRS